MQYDCYGASFSGKISDGQKFRGANETNCAPRSLAVYIPLLYCLRNTTPVGQLWYTTDRQGSSDIVHGLTYTASTNSLKSPTSLFVHFPLEGNQINSNIYWFIDLAHRRLVMFRLRSILASELVICALEHGQPSRGGGNGWRGGGGSMYVIEEEVTTVEY